MSETTISLQGNAVTAVLLVAVMLLGTVAAAAPAVASDSSIDAQQIDDNAEPADEIYVDGDGDAVLVYEDDDGDDELTTFDLGMHVSEGLAHTLIEGDIEEDELDESAAGGMSLVLEEDRFFGEGDLQMESPDELEDMTLDVYGEQSSETSEFDADLEMIFEGDDAADDFESFETTGDADVTPDTFATSGDVNAELGTVQGGEFYYDVSVTDTGDGYTLDVTQDEIVSQFQTGMWETEEAAEQTLDAQYGMIAEEFDGTTEITIESYTYTETADGEGDLDISYSVELQNVQDGFADVFAQVLAEDQELDLSQSEADALAQSLVDVEIDTMEFTADQSGSTLNADWTIELSNLEGAVDEMVTLVDSIDAPELEDELDEFQDTVEAQQAADLEQYYEWSATVEQYDAEHDRVDLSLSTDTENWSEYIDELEERDIDGTMGDMTIDLNAEIDDNDVLVADMALEVEQEELVEQALDSMIEAAAEDPMAGPEVDEFLTDLEDSEFEIAAMDVNVDGETVEIEAGAQFGNMEALSDEINDAFGGHEVTEIAGALDDDTMGVHVHVDALVDADADEGDVSALAVADDDTEIYMDGDWDRDFNEMDTAAAQEFLTTQSEEGMDDEGADDDDSLPGFGPLVALFSLIAVALFARNRN
ncbi:PGF-CTERM sorting domain-containing protein [Natranaeroarchaeum aerophilus]|uniref:PGF-CTERM sorting domain-containing protein n=1 Tax=Natranaeroarchaeum aerophilus TaxID=2917711 RepID=A0AAE3K4J7_9EURY|nr:PGF-CTERM sorting domain-containing protein [Natranaeroarchaeum aerophilus]MCL9813206.1 PGF-CTERM sorting domain-containing protein [Natranaeroarchaeum aerophilus]